MDTQRETIVFVEFWPKAKGRLRPFQVVTLELVPSKSGRPGYSNYNWYDCAVMNDGTLIYDQSGCGSLDKAYVTRGPWWAARGINVEHHGERRVTRLPKSLRTWPPSGIDAVEAGIVDCPECGYLPDDGAIWPDDENRICPHLEWNEEYQGWMSPSDREEVRAWGNT